MQEIRKDITLFGIDINQLDREWLEGPKTIYIVSEEMAKAREEVQQAESDVELAKTERKETEARLRLRIQNNPKKYNLKTATIASVEAAILLCSSYKKVKQKCIDAQNKLNRAWNKVNHTQSLLTALQYKKDSLEYLVKLHGQNYFSIPKIPYDDKGRRFIEDAEKRRARTRNRK